MHTAGSMVFQIVSSAIQNDDSRHENAGKRRRYLSLRSSVIARFPARFDTEISGERGVNVGLGKADNLGREFDEGQPALFHQVVNRPLADVQSPRDLRLGFVVRRSGKICSFLGHARSFVFGEHPAARLPGEGVSPTQNEFTQSNDTNGSRAEI